jgi:epoxyqueuosine reductase
MTTSTSEAAPQDTPRDIALKIAGRLPLWARNAGFDVCGVAALTPGGGADESWPAAARLARFVELGRHGDMAWMVSTAQRRAHPRALWPNARSAIVLGLNYGPESDPMAGLAARAQGVISVYAQGRDYHDLIKGRLKALAGRIARAGEAEVKVFVDTAPLMEKPLAAAAGLGWQGKHTNLVSRAFGSWLFLGAILTDLALPASAAETDHCGACRACLDICPTKAFPAPYQLDARRCISYLTIEHAGPVPEALRPALGNRIYGCDDCLAVCPWNKFAQAARESALQPRPALAGPALEALAALDDATFRALFSANPVKRIGRNRFVRNVLYAIGNSGLARLGEAARGRLDDADETVREAARWALERIAGASRPPKESSSV